MIRWRAAVADDVPAVVALPADDMLGQAREGTDLAPYQAAFAAMSTMSEMGVIQDFLRASFSCATIDDLAREIGRTLEKAAAIDSFEARNATLRPWA